MNTYIETTVFIGVVFSVALLFWVVRSINEAEPAPLLSTLTYFAFVGECILIIEMLREDLVKGPVLALFPLDLLLLLCQIYIIRAQRVATFDHYVRVLDENRIGNIKSADIEKWANVMLRITGVDFYPEFYYEILKGSNPRERRRSQAVWILPPAEFRLGAAGISLESLLIPPQDRRFLWRAYE